MTGSQFMKMEPLINAMDRRFNKNNLMGWLNVPIMKFLKANEYLFKKENIPPRTIDLIHAKKHTKEELLLLVCLPFINKKIFRQFRTFLHVDTRVILDALVWEESLHQDEIEERFDIQIYQETINKFPGGYEQKRTSLDPRFKFLQMGYSYYYWQPEQEFTLKLLDPLRRILIDYYDAPEGKDLIPLDKIEETDFLYTNGEQDILLELPRLLAYSWQGHIKTTTKGKPQLSTLGKMQRKLNLQEFYKDSQDKELKIIRTNLLAGLLTTLPNPKKEINQPVLIKILIQNYYTTYYHSLLNIISYLKGAGYIEPYRFKKVEPVFLTVLQSLPPNKWISLDNIEKHIKYNILDVEVIPPSLAKEKLYYVYEDEEAVGYYYDNKRYVTEGRFQRSLIRPLIKGTLYLFAAFGLLDIAFDEVDTSVIGKTSESPYDGLRFVRLNNLGAYVCGFLPDYEPPESFKKSKITLSTDSLTILTDKNDATAAILLEPYTEKVSPNRFRTDFTFFLRDCKNKRDLNDKINLFKQAISSDLPKNWQDFFKELEGKINPLENVANVKIYRIPTDNQPLIRLIARDAQLKKLCRKAEGYYVLVEKTKVSQFKKRLQEFGYLLT